MVIGFLFLELFFCSTTGLTIANEVTRERMLVFKDVMLSILDIRVFTTVFSVICVFHMLAMSYQSFYKNKQHTELNTSTVRGLVLGPIFLLLLKYFLIVYSLRSPNLFNHFSSVFKFSTTAYIVLGAIDLAMLVAFISLNCIGSVANRAITLVSFLYIFVVRCMISSQMVSYFFDVIYLDLICVSFVIAFLFTEKEKFIDYFFKTCSYVKKIFKRDTDN